MDQTVRGLLQRIHDSVVFLYDLDGDEPIGTAFVVGIPLHEGSDKVFPLVVTAKHVVADSPGIRARFNTGGGAPARSYDYDLASLRKSGDFWVHDDPGVDIAVFRTPHMDGMDLSVAHQRIIADKATFEAQDIKITDRVIFPSLLTQFIGVTRNRPVMRDGSICLIPDEPVPLKYRVGERTISTEQEVILVDTRSILGVSGSPVHLWPGPRVRGSTLSGEAIRPWLLGVMHGFFLAPPREVGSVETRAKPAFEENSGIAIVFPSWRLVEILQQPKLKQRLDTLGNQEQRADPSE